MDDKSVVKRLSQKCIIAWQADGQQSGVVYLKAAIMCPAVKAAKSEVKPGLSLPHYKHYGHET